MKTTQKGFSVVEILVVIVAVGIIGAAGWLVYDRQKSNETIFSSQTVEKATVAAPAQEIDITVLAAKVEEMSKLPTEKSISLLIERESVVKGPKYQVCGVKEDPYDKTWVNAYYYPSDDTLDVFYMTWSENGVVAKSDGYKDDTEWSARRDDFGKNNINKEIIDGLLNNVTSDSIVVVNDDGTPKTDNKVSLIDFDGQKAYSYTVKLKNDTGSGDCAPELRRFVVGATDFDGLAEEIYYGSVSKSTLYATTNKKVEKLNATREEALQILEKEGYVDATAQDLKAASGY